jgi:hypothetical protein
VIANERNSHTNLSKNYNSLCEEQQKIQQNFIKIANGLLENEINFLDENIQNELLMQNNFMNLLNLNNFKQSY